MPGATVVTGVSSGIGLETAIYLAKRNYRVVGTMRNLSKRTEFDEAIRQAGVSVDLVALDLQSNASMESAVADVVQRYGGIDSLVNNAGVQLRGYFEDLTEEEIRSAFETNVFGTMALTRLVIPGMRAARQGRMVFLSSVGGLMGSLGLTGYCATKFALEGFAESLALEMALFRIQVSVVEPGIVNTPMWGTKLLIAKASENPASPNRAYWVESERIANWAVKTSPIRPIHVARAIHHALSAKNPKLRYLVGSRPAAFLLARRLLPTAIFDRVYNRTVIARMKRVAPSN